MLNWFRLLCLESLKENASKPDQLLRKCTEDLTFVEIPSQFTRQYFSFSKPLGLQLVGLCRVRVTSKGQAFLQSFVEGGGERGNFLSYLTWVLDFCRSKARWRRFNRYYLTFSKCLDSFFLEAGNGNYSAIFFPKAKVFKV